MNKTSIEWTDFTWNPVTGCNKVSQGCKNCYAETIAIRFWGDRKFTDVIMHEERLIEARKSFKKWTGKRVFVCSMSDLFHESVTSEFITMVWHEMYLMPNTTFQILTKRPDRALTEINRINESNLWGCTLPNVWIGTSCEDQATADLRIPLLLQIPAAVRFLSCEPLLGPIDLTELDCEPEYPGHTILDSLTGELDSWSAERKCKPIDWVIAGGESGHGARPMHPEWVRSLRDQCNAANVPFFFKQWGEYVPLETADGEMFYCSASTEGDDLLHGISYTKTVEGKGGISWVKVGKSKAGNYIDQIQHLNFPAKV